MGSRAKSAVMLAFGAVFGYAVGVATAPFGAPSSLVQNGALRAALGAAPGGAADQAAVAPGAERHAEDAPADGSSASAPAPAERSEDDRADGVAAGESPSSATDEAAAEPTLRERLQAAPEAERTQLLGALVASLRGLAPDARAKQLTELFKATGWFGDQPGPPLDPAAWRLAVETLDELPAGGARDPLLQTLGEQLARVRGTSAMGTLMALTHLTLADEQARVRGRDPDPDAAAVARLRQHLVDGAASETLGDEAALYGAFGLGGAAASRADQEALMRLATAGKMARIRLAGYFALATTPPSAAVDDFLVREASRGGVGWKQRVMAWQALCRRGREELLPASVVQELLIEWERSGTFDLGQLLND